MPITETRKNHHHKTRNTLRLRIITRLSINIDYLTFEDHEKEYCNTRSLGPSDFWLEACSGFLFHTNMLIAHQCYQHILHHKKSKSTSSLQASGSLCHLIVDHIESKNTNGINVLLHPSWTPPPVVARGCKCGNTNFHLRQIDENKKD